MQQGEGDPIAILHDGSSSETALLMTARMALDLGQESWGIGELFRNILSFADVDRHVLVVSIRARERGLRHRVSRQHWRRIARDRIKLIRHANWRLFGTPMANILAGYFIDRSL
jgi:hypothetical protein